MMAASSQPPRRSWTDKREHSRLSGELAQTEGAEFERRVLLLLEAMWPRTRITASGDGVLRVEAEGGDEPRSRWICCLGFPPDKTMLELPEARDACDAVSRFEAGRLSADVFLLIHNRDGRDKAFREQVRARLRELEASGRVRKAELWDRQRLLQEAFNTMLRQLTETVSDESVLATAEDPRLSLEAVLLRKSSLTIDQYQLKTSVRGSPEVDDPAVLLSDPGEDNLSLLVGEFGSGKTTAVRRAFQYGSLRTVIAPGAVVSDRVKSTKDLLDSCFRYEGLFSDRPDDVREISQFLARPVLEYLLKDPALPIALILDGVDESAFLTRRGGFQRLFNMLRDVKVPVVLTMRSELWHRGQGDFAAAFGERSESQPLRHRRFRLIELLPWTPRQVGALIERHRHRAATPRDRTRLDALADLASAGRLGELYGDLPERPLFLRLILESVVEQGLPDQKIGRARLLRDWARFKVLRDVHEPIRAGGAGRVPLLEEGESSETTFEIAWEAMVGAASKMVQEYDGSLELTADCELDSVLASSPRLHGFREPLGLFLNSLLLAAPYPLGTPPRVRFAHRSFQEFFLAWALLTRDDVPQDPPPPSVTSWMRQIEEEGLLDPASDGARRRSPPPTPSKPVVTPDVAPPYPDLVIRVGVERREGATRLSFVLTSATGKAGFHRRRIHGEPLRTPPEEYHARLHETIESLHDGACVDGERALRSEATSRFENLGRELYDGLFPSSLREAYRLFRKDVKTLLIISDEPWIPWELVKPFDDTDRSEPIDDDFLCSRFHMTRWLTGKAKPAVVIDPRRVVCFEAGSVDDRLEHAAAELEWFEAFAGRHRLDDRSLADASRADILGILEEGGLGLVHLVGHGQYDARHPDESRLLLADGSSLRPRDLRGPIQTRLKGSRPLFFLNACQVGRQGWSLTGLGGWAARCVQGCECGAFVAPQWTVGDDLAQAFATAFYESLEGGASFSRAASVARERVRQLDASRPSWLAYAVYAHPEGRLCLNDGVGGAQGSVELEDCRLAVEDLREIEDSSG